MISDYQRRRSPNPYAHDKRIRVKVNVRPRNQLICETLVDQGEHIIEIPATFEPELKKMVVDLAKVKLAEEAAERSREEYARTTKRDPKLSTISTESEYQRLFREGMPPLNSIEVLDRDLPAPLTDAQRQQTAIAEAVATAVVGKSGNKPKRSRKASDES